MSAWNALPMLDRLFDDVLPPPAANHATFAVRANKEEIVLTADVPGVKREDLDVTLDDGVLTIKGQRKGYGSFTRSFSLPETVDPEKLSANLEDGVLTIRVAQLPKSQPRKIAITAAASTPAPQLDAKA